MTTNYKKIAFQGALGAYSDLACRTAFPDIETLPCPSFDHAFTAVQEGEADLAMIPIDNTIAGRVADVHHLMPGSGLFIIAEHFQPIEHNLLGIPGGKIEDLTNVYSHVHAIPQCRKLIKKLRLNAHVHADTASAAKEVAALNDPARGAISSSLAAQIYGLDILQDSVQDENHNTTRFLVLSPKAETPALNDHDHVVTTLTFEVRNIPAALYKSLGGFATNGLSMAKLESYVDENFQAARFYCDVEGHQDSEAFKLALEELGFYAKDINILGTYPAHSFRKNI